MSQQNTKPGKSKGPAVVSPKKPVQPVQAVPEAEPVISPRPPLFRRLDWMTFGITTFLVFIGYFLTLAPDLTLEDSGELAVASYYAGVPHPPGYPVWTIYTWLFTELVPFSNVAWRVALSSAVAGALACGLLGLLVSRGSSMLLEGIPGLQEIERRSENVLCVVAGFVSGMLLAFNGFMWSQAVIVEVYTLSVLSFMGVLCCLLRWMYAPEQRRYLYWAFFLFGICFTNHQTLIVAAMGIQVAIVAAQPKVGRDLLLGNSIIYLAGLGLKAAGMMTAFDGNLPLFLIYNLVGIGSITAFGWLTITTRTKQSDWVAFGRDLLFAGAAGYVLILIAIEAQVLVFAPRRVGDGSMLMTQAGLKLIHLFGLGALFGCGWLVYQTLTKGRKSLPLPVKIAFGYGVFYLFVVFLSSFRHTTWLNGSVPVFLLHHLLGIGAGAFLIRWLAQTTGLGSEIKVLVMAAVAWVAGASFYLYMPIASMTNPPLNWAYPRTVEGFWHIMTRGQYDKTKPTESVYKFVEQLGMYFEGAKSEFSLVALCIGLIPFAFFSRMQKRERSWIIGLSAIFLCLAVLLMVLLNPNVDRAAANQARVFFTASHIVIAIAIGYGITLIGGLVATQYKNVRTYLWYGGAAALGIELYYLLDTFGTTHFPLLRFAAVLGFALAGAFTAIILWHRDRAPLFALVIVFAVFPARSILSNWSDNEQRGHLFGYWFGHDMFSPPFEIYPEMSRDAILFGGTDPGRFNPTYMIFAESFLPPKKKRDPDFDRRDVYIITQNALADKTYLDYIRAHYNRSAQVDPYFFSEFVRTRTEREQGRTNILARALLPVDRYFTDLGARVEQKRRQRGVYPPKEIHTPTTEESEVAFHEYVMDAQRRLHLGQLRPNEDVRIVNDRVQVSGHVAVMALNGILTKNIFDNNPDHEFYLEESFPLEWMFPHLTPHGIILKINREPVEEITEEILRKDHEFWRRYSERLIGNWITHETTVEELSDFVERTFLRRDFRGFTGDRKFVRDDVAQKAFSKLRSAIGGLYTWHLADPGTSPLAYERLLREAEFAFKQAYAFCPESPEAVFKYVSLLASTGRFDDAELIVQTSLRFDPQNENLRLMEAQLKLERERQTRQPFPSPQPLDTGEQAQAPEMGNLDAGLEMLSIYAQARQTNAALQMMDQILSSQAADASALLTVAQHAANFGDRQRLMKVLEQLKGQTHVLENQHQTEPGNMQRAFELVSIYLILQETNRAMELLDKLAGDPQADASTLLSAAQAYAQLQNFPKLESTLQKLAALLPESPEAWYDLAAVQSLLGKNSAAIQSLDKAMGLAQRRGPIPGVQDLKVTAANDPRFQSLKNLPEFQRLTARSPGR
jgi:tetratricopeptide (TPR) repeat protein